MKKNKGANNLFLNNKIRIRGYDIAGWMLLIPAVVIVLVFNIIPKVQCIMWSFFDMNGYKLTEFVGLDNYIRVLSDTAFLKTLWNTCQYVFWSILFGYFLPIIVAVLMNEIVHMRNTLRIMVYFPTALPGIAVSMLWYFVFYPSEAGMLNTLLGHLGVGPFVWLQDARYTIPLIILSSTWAGAGATSIYYFSALQGVNRELYEAALIDGAGFFRRLRTVAFPHISGIALLFLVRQIISVFSIMEQPMQMTGGGPNNASLSLGLLSYRYGFVSIKPQLSMALGVIMFLILLVATFFYYRLDKKVEDNQM